MSSPNPNNPQSGNPSSGNGDTYRDDGSPHTGFRTSSLNETLRQLSQQYWKVLSQPGASTFVEELPKASWDSILTQLLLMSVIEAAFLFIDQLLNIRTFLSQLLFIQSFALPLILGFNLIAFFLWTGLTYIVARGFKGVSSYKHYCYGYALLLVPVSIVGGFLNFIPGIGEQLAVLPVIYSFVLQIFMIMGVQQLNGSRSMATVLLSSFILIVLVMLLALIVTPNVAFNMSL